MDELRPRRQLDFERERRRLWVRRGLNRHRQFQKTMTKARARIESSYSNDGDLIFPNTLGGPMDAANFVRREYRPALRRAGLPMVKWHGLRHTFVSLPIAEGLAPKLISELCGHASIAITMDRYGNLFDSVADDHLRSDAIERAFELPSAAEAVAAASGPPPLTVRPELPWWPRPPRSGAAAG